MTSIADLDKEINAYLDSKDIFKQLKSAFQPPSSSSEQDTSMSFSGAGNKKVTALEPIIEETNLLVQSKQRSKKIEQLLTKVKKATQKPPGQIEEAPLAITEGPKPVAAITAPPVDTFLTSMKGVNLDNSDMTDDALLRQFEELSRQDPNFGKKKKKKGMHAHLADELLDDLD